MLDRLLSKPISVTMVLLVFVILGFVGIGKLPVSLIPDVDIPYITVQITEPSMSARELDEVLVRPIRQSLLQMSHLKDIKTVSKDGTATITLSFDEGEDMDFFYIEVNEKIDRALSGLPKINHPKVFKASATDIPAFYVNMKSKESDPDAFARMSDFAREVISKRLEQLPQVAMVDVSGMVSREILIVPDVESLIRLDITISEFENILSSSNVSLSNLVIRDGEYHYNVKFQSFVSTPDDIRNAYFKVNDRLLQIKDVAKVEERNAPRSGLVLSDDEDAIVFAIVKQSDARMAELRRGINNLIEYFSKDYPQVDFIVTRDQTALLDYSIKNLLLNIILAIFLDCIVIFFFMKDFKTPILVSMTIPVSLVVSFFFFYVFGVTINIISLSGLLLGVGMMVDNTIVLTDNITARWQRGDALRISVVDGTKEVAGPMLSSVLTTCAVFVPMIFLNGLAGELFYDQAMAIAIVLMSSYLVTVVALPVYYWAMYHKQDSFIPNEHLAKIQFTNGMKLYDSIVNWFLANRRCVWVTVFVCTLCIGFAVTWMPREKLPEITYADAIAHINWNEPVTIERNREMVMDVTSSVKHLCLQSTAMVGVQQFVLGHSGDQGITESSLYFKCENADNLNFAKQRIAEYIHVQYPSATLAFTTSGNVFDMVFAQKDPQLIAKLRPVANNLMNVDNLRKMFERVRTVLPDVYVDEVPLKTDVLYTSDPELMALYDISFEDLTDVLRNSLNGNVLFEILSGDRSVPVVLGTDVNELQEILATTELEKEGYSIPVSAVMRQGWSNDFREIIAGEDGVYYPVNIDVPGNRVQSVIRAINKVVQDDGTFSVSFSGAWFSNREILRQMLMILLIAILLLFLILASQFESLIQPVIILVEIVIDIAVCLLVLWAAGVSMNLMSMIGLIVICGIVINDSILKIDTINRLVKDEMAVETAIHEAGHRRIKAIIMTSLTTVLAVTPFLGRGNMGDDLQYPMALTIIVGMVVGTFVSLFIVPSVYSAFYSKKR